VSSFFVFTARFDAMEPVFFAAVNDTVIKMRHFSHYVAQKPHMFLFARRAIRLIVRATAERHSTLRATP